MDIILDIISVSTPRALLIDLDNCPSQLAQLAQAVAYFTRVVVCYGGFEPKIHLSQITQLAPALVEGRLSIESMDRKGKNAADFGLTFWAGRLLAEMPPETEFLVLSRDTDLDYLLDMLRRAGRKADRFDGNTYPEFGADTPAQETTQVNDPLLGNAVEDYCTAHIIGRRTRPARRLTLLNSIRSYFKGNAHVEGDAVLQELIQRGVLSLGKGGQVIYRDRVRAGLLRDLPPVPTPDTAVVSPQEMPVVLEQPAPMAPTTTPESLPADEYYAAHIADQRNRPARRVALLNSIRTYFHSRTDVDPEVVITELFQREMISQSRTGQIRYHDAHTLETPTPTEEPSPLSEVKAKKAPATPKRKVPSTNTTTTRHPRRKPAVDPEPSQKPQPTVDEAPLATAPSDSERILTVY